MAGKAGSTKKTPGRPNDNRSESGQDRKSHHFKTEMMAFKKVIYFEMDMRCPLVIIYPMLKVYLLCHTKTSES